MDFDTIHDRTGTHCAKWDSMESLFGVSPATGLAMWVADMDFRAPDPVCDLVKEMGEHGFFGYFGEDATYRESIRWWMQTRHGWSLDPAHVFSTHGLVNAVGLCLDAFTAPGDGICLMTPVYHAFHKVIRAADRRIVSLPLAQVDGRYTLDLEGWEARMTGSERMLILCSPHNPGGRVWSRAELEAVAAFARRHDLLIVSDEIHHDLVMPGHRHIPMPLIDDVSDRLVMLTAASKTFNIAGTHIGNVTIADAGLRGRFAARMAALGLSPNLFGMRMVPACYSPQGAEWVDALCARLAENARVFDAAIAGIPGLRTMPLEATYLAWVDFSGTGMDHAEIARRLGEDARIAASPGPQFGEGGDSFMRFNLAMPRARIEEAGQRIAAAFADLQ